MVKNMLTKKLFRDMWQAKWQFLSIIILCALGVMIFSGFDAMWRNIEVSTEQYFAKFALADLWVKVPEADRATVSRISHIDGVAKVQARAVEDGHANELPAEPTVKVHGYDGSFIINQPQIMEGTTLADNDMRGCVMEKQFADAQKLMIGDDIQLTIQDIRYSFIIRGLVTSPEYIWSANDILPDPTSYGYILVQYNALPEIPLNEILVTAEGGADISYIQKQIESIFPYAFVLNHDSHISTSNIMGEVKQFQSLSIVFPFLFFLVAAMVVLTTISRMVDSQRMQMGTLKSLGYNDIKLFSHYISYGLYPALVGSAIGLLIGQSALPTFLWGALSKNYTLPEKSPANISPLALLVGLAAVVLSMSICYISCRRQLKETTAELLRPKPPKAGSRILLERFSRFWNRLSFNSKLICRNVFRAKARSLMALFGVLACTALIIVSLGMNDSFNRMISSYYEKTYTNDLQVTLKRDAGILESYQKRLPADVVEGTMEKTVSIQGGDTSRTVLLSVIDDNQTIVVFNTKTGSSKPPEDGIIITEKLAQVMGLSLGDEVIITLPGDKQPIYTQISQLAPISIGQGIFTSKTAWDSLRKGPFIPTKLLIKNPAKDCMAMLDRMDTVDSYIFSTEQFQKTQSVMQALTGVVVLLFTFALVLAAVVLYNMGVLNFVERIREFATLKVLGYHKKEIQRLIIRENALISITGAILGILPGVFLTGITMKISEPEDMVMTSVISPISILIACITTITFSIIIQFILARKVDSIDMVGALKSVE